MAWLATGAIIGIADADVRPGNDATHPPRISESVGRLLQTTVAATSAIGGFVVVGQMLQVYGVCTRIT